MPLTRPADQLALANELGRAMDGRCTLAEALMVYGRLYVATALTVVLASEDERERARDLAVMEEAIDALKADLRASLAVSTARARAT